MDYLMYIEFEPINFFAGRASSLIGVLVARWLLGR